MNQCVIRCDAGLTAVDQLAKGDPRCRVIHRVTLFDDHRRFAPQFQRYGHQIPAGGLHDLAPDGGAAGEDQMIERQRRKGGTDIRIAVDHCDLLLREQRAQDLFQQRIGGRCEFRRLQHHAVASSHRRGQRHQRKDQRIIPRRHHAHHAQRLILHPRHTLPHLQRDMALFGPHHARQILVQVVDAAQHAGDLCQACLDARPMPEIRVNGCFDAATVFDNRRTQFCKIGTTLRNGGCPVTAVSRSLCRQQAFGIG